jgi:hypothetical protein
LEDEDTVAPAISTSAAAGIAAVAADETMALAADDDMNSQQEMTVSAIRDLDARIIAAIPQASIATKIEALEV